jgi:Spy/CpxP family protein refolding chaperone
MHRAATGAELCQEIMMNRILFKLIPGTALMGVLLLSAGAWSMGPPPEFNIDKRLSHMTDELALSDTQKQQVEALLEGGRETGAADLARLAEIRKQMKAMHADFDPGIAQKLADELGEISARMAYQMTSTHAEIYQLLSPEQREQFTAMSKQRDQRMGKRWAGRRD